MTDENAETQRPANWWLMPLWLACVLLTIVFALVSYFAGMWYPVR